MIHVSFSDCIQMTGGVKLCGPEQGMIHGVSTDSRQIAQGMLFVPLKGERFDAHDFVPQAIAHGAVAVLWQEGHPCPEPVPEGILFIGVPDTLAALQRLAREYRRRLPVQVIGVTGSNGKTSTKDMIASVLGERYKVQKTEGNLNNHIGVPLTLLRLREDTKYAVVEMGMSSLGEIRLLADIAQPQIGVITNIGEAHLEKLGSRENIAEAKMELVEALPPDGLAVLNGDEPLLRQRVGRTQAEVVWFGFSDGNDIQVKDWESRGMDGSLFSVKGFTPRFYLPVPGQHQLANAMAALAVARRAGLSDEEAAAGLANVSLSGMRFEVHPGRLGGLIINDAYNASPSSMRAALQTVAGLSQGDGKIAVLGDMLELGPEAERWHELVGEWVAAARFDRLVAIGRYAEAMLRGARRKGMKEAHLQACRQADEALPVLSSWQRSFSHPLVLVKASRGMKLETIVQSFIGRSQGGGGS